MAEHAANTPIGDHLWGELTRLVGLVGLTSWSGELTTALWADPETTIEDVEDLVDGLRLDLLRLAASVSGIERQLCEVLELAVGHLHVHEWAAQTRPSCDDEEPLGPVVDLDVHPRPADPVAVRALVAAGGRLDEARELARELAEQRRSG